MNAEEIAETLSVARSNVSTSLSELQSWGIVRPVHLLGDRREHYEAMKDVWEMARVILDERRRPECVTEVKPAEHPDESTLQRLQEMLGFLEIMTSLYDELRVLPSRAARKLGMRCGRLRKLFNG